MKRLAYILLFSMLVFSCKGAKYYVKEGEKYDKVGDYDNASANYAEAYRLDPGNKDAKKGFKKSGQKMLDQLLDDFKQDFQAAKYKDAMADYNRALKFSNNVSSRGIELVIPQESKDLYEQSIERYHQKLYLDASNAIISMDYQTASDLLKELRSANPSYDGLQQLERSLEADPVYMQAVNAYNKGQKLIAVQGFNKVSTIYPGYRETDTYLSELSQLPKQAIVMFPFENKSRDLGVERLVYQAVEAEFKQMASPLFSYIGEAPVQTELIKLGKSSQPPFDENSIIQVTKNLLGTRTLVISVADVVEEPVANDESFQIAYAREKVINWDPYYGNTVNYQWRETKYKEVDEGVKYAIFIQVKIYDPLSGALIYNDVVTKSIISRVKYAKYDGDYNDLYPTMGYISNTELNKWKSRFTSNSQMKSKSELLDLLIKSASKDISEMVYSKLN